MEPLFNVGQTVWLKRDGKEAIVHGVAGLWLWLDMLDGRQPETTLATDCVAKRKFKVGDAALLTCTIIEIDEADGRLPYRIRVDNCYGGTIVTSWINEDALRADA